MDALEEKKAQEIFDGFPKFPVKAGEEPGYVSWGAETYAKSYYLVETEDCLAYMDAIENAGITLREKLDGPLRGSRYFAVYEKNGCLYSLHYAIPSKRIILTGSRALFDAPWTKEEAFSKIPPPSFGRLVNPERPSKNATLSEAGCSSGEGFYTDCFYDVEKRDYEAYQNVLKSAGFSCVYDRLEGLEGSVFTSRFEKASDERTHSVVLTYFLRMKRLDLTAGFDLTHSPRLFDRPEFRQGEISGKKTTLHMMELFRTGNSFVVQLKNGHFLISDGAFHWDLPYLLDYLEELAPSGEKPVIEGWFLTHAHPDHVGCFNGFLARPEYADRVSIEGFYYAIPGELPLALDVRVRDCIWKMRKTLKLVKNSGGHPTPVYRPHTGDRYYFDDITVDIAVSHMDVPFVTYAGDFNDSSIWTLLTIGGQTVMLGGDGDQGCIELLQSAYRPEFAAFDFFSVLHHGHNVWEELVSYLHPVTCLCPAPVEGPGYRRDWTDLLKQRSKEYFDFSDGTSVFEFPYHPGERKVWKRTEWKYNPGEELYIPKEFSRRSDGSLILWAGRWIKAPLSFGERTPVYVKTLPEDARKVRKVLLYITAEGVYEAVMNGQRVGDLIFAPGCICGQRVQAQEYDVTDLYRVGKENRLEVTVGRGWSNETAVCLMAQLRIEYEDGHKEATGTDETWDVFEGPVVLNGIYEGEVCDATRGLRFFSKAEKTRGSGAAIVPTEGGILREHEILSPVRVLRTPEGETVLDFGEEITGYVKLTLKGAKAGETVDLSFGKALGRDGNFRNLNFRFYYVCRDGDQEYKPKFSFCSFRCVRINAFPGGVGHASEAHFKGITLYSDTKRVFQSFH